MSDINPCNPFAVGHYSGLPRVCMGGKKIFITDYVGLSAKLETLPMAFVISEYYGHEVCLDWPELDSFTVEGARRQGLGITGRIGALKLRDYSDELFYQIRNHRNVILRTLQGPAHLLERAHIPTAKRVKLRPDYVQVIRDAFAPYANRPVVGVHIRRGDFELIDDGVFDANRVEWPATPTWWYEFVLDRIARVHKNVAFFISCSGDSDQFNNLKKNFDVFELPTSFPYGYKGPDHYARRHPTVDLFALGCCSVMVASSCSTFSHYSANALGEPCTCLIPPAQTSKANPQFGKTNLHGKGVAAWWKACREGANVQMVADDTMLPEPTGASIDWL